MGKANLPPIHPFIDLDPLLPSTQKTQEFDSVIAIPEEQNGLLDVTAMMNMMKLAMTIQSRSTMKEVYF